ncbi:hypothetical protein PG984_016317 [Apiospora sp. TS-2023a]
MRLPILRPPNRRPPNANLLPHRHLRPASPGESPEDCPNPELPPDMNITHHGIYPSSMCRHTVKTHLKNLTKKLLDSLIEISELVQHEARLEFEAADAARERLRLSLLHLREALEGDGDLPRARSLLEEVSHDAVIIRDRSARCEAVRESISDLLQRATDDARDTAEKAEAVFEGRFSPSRGPSSERSSSGRGSSLR